MGGRNPFLPFEVTAYAVKEKENKKLRVCHAPTNRFFKGSDLEGFSPFNSMRLLI
jgi:hypothetical protein